MFNSSGKLINVRNLVPSIRLMRRKRWQGELSSEFGRSCQQNLIFFYLTRDLTKPKQVHQRDTGVARTKTRPLYQIAIFINLHQNVMEWIEIGVLTAQSGSIGGYYPLGKGRLQKPESRKLSVRGGRNFTYILYIILAFNFCVFSHLTSPWNVLGFAKENNSDTIGDTESTFPLSRVSLQILITSSVTSTFEVDGQRRTGTEVWPEVAS